MADEPEIKLRPAGSANTRWGAAVVETDDDGILGFMSLRGCPADMTLENLDAIFNELNLHPDFVIKECREEILAAARENRPIIRVKIAEGHPVKLGNNASLEFHKRPRGVETKIEESVAKVNYREVKAVDNVQAGELLATYFPMTEGEGGADIFGRVIPPPKTHDVSITVGENVRYDDSTRQYYATASGYIRYQRKTLSVHPVYQVEGDVDLSEGNIRFIGRIEVRRDVRDEFCLEAGEGIHIGGTAEACSLKAEREIIIEGGVTGKGKGLIECKGGLRCRFLNDTTATIGGDVVIEKEIVNSRVHCMGRVIVTRGTIVGSEVVALRGILVRDAGSSLGVKTALIAGLDYRVAEKLLGINRDLVQFQEKQQKLLNRAGPLIDRLLKSPAIDNRRREEVDDMVSSIRQLQRQICQLDQTSGELMRSFSDQAINCVSIGNSLYPGVTVVAGKYERENHESLTGPISLEPDIERRQLTIQGGLAVERFWSDEAKPRPHPKR